MRNARVLVGVGVVAVVAILVWRCRGEEASSDDDPATSSSTSPQTKDPVTGAPRWFGQQGVAGRRIAGLVLDGTGAPLRGATVRLASTLTMSGLRAEPSATSDASGGFDFGPQPAAAYLVVAEAPKLTGALAQIDLRDATAKPDELRLVLHPCDAAIHGTVRDTAGGVIPGALVSRAQSAITTAAGAVADAAGHYELCVPRGRSAVIAKADGYAANPDQILVTGRTRRDFELVPGTNVIGRVVRAGDRAPVEGAIVELRSADQQFGFAHVVATSDREGRFQLADVPPGRHVVTASADRARMASPVEVFAELGQPGNEVLCELAPAVSVSGKVVTHTAEKPVGGLGVYMRKASGQTDNLQAITQPDGTFVIDRVLPGTYQPWLRASREPLESVTVATTDVTNLVLYTEEGATISGRVLHAGKPIDGASVRSNESQVSTTSDHTGRFTLRNVKPGSNRLYAESDRVGAFTNVPPITVAAGEQRTGVDIELDLAGSITGVVVDQNAAPVAGAFLRFSLLGGRDFGMATTADDGSFTTRGLSGGGDYVFEVRQREDSALAFPPVTGKRHAPIAVRDGQTHVTGVHVQVRVVRLAIAGRVVDADGNPVADASVRVFTGARGWFQVQPAISDESGAFTLRDVPPGTYTVQASSSRGDANEENVEGGRSGLVLKLAAFGRIEGTLEGFTDTPEIIAYRAGDGRQHRGVVTGNTFQIRNLPAGEYYVAASTLDGREMVNTTVAAGATQQLALRRRSPTELGSIAGVVVDETTRAPVAGLRCASYPRERRYTDYRPNFAISDASGAFRIDRLPVGAHHVGCWGKDVMVDVETSVTANQVTRVELAAKRIKRDRPTATRGHAGMKLEWQLEEVRVKSVETNGPAARAGIVVGDVLVKLDEQPLHEGPGAIYAIEARGPGKSVKLGIERGDKELTVTLTLGARTTDDIDSELLLE